MHDPSLRNNDIVQPKAKDSETDGASSNSIVSLALYPGGNRTHGLALANANVGPNSNAPIEFKVPAAFESENQLQKLGKQLADQYLKCEEAETLVKYLQSDSTSALLPPSPVTLAISEDCQFIKIRLGGGIDTTVTATPDAIEEYIKNSKRAEIALKEQANSLALWELSKITLISNKDGSVALEDNPRSRIVLQANEITFNCDNNGEIILDRQASNTYLRISRFFEVVQSSRPPLYISPERGFQVSFDSFDKSRLEKALKACGINFERIGDNFKLPDLEAMGKYFDIYQRQPHSDTVLLT